MMRHLTSFSLIVFLTGCGHVAQLHNINPSANDFSSALASEYQAYADSEAEQGRLFAAEHYAHKGLRALKGEAVEPELLTSSLTEQEKQELTQARASLMTLMTEDVKRVVPQKLARAQLLFDCWIHELRRDLNQEQAPCPDEFHSAMTELNDVANSILYDQETSYTLAFAPKSAKLGANHLATVKKIIHQIHTEDRYAIEIEAHSKKGVKFLRLTEMRLEEVRKALIKQGAAESSIAIKKEDDSKKVFLSYDEQHGAYDNVVITVKTRSETKSEAA